MRHIHRAAHRRPRTAEAQLRPALRGLALATVALAILTASGCTGDFAPPSLVDTVRILAVRAEPPYLPSAATETTRVDAKVVGVAPGEPLCHAWALCLKTSTKGGAFGCLDPALALELGTDTSATIRFDQVVSLAAQGQQYLVDNGLQPKPGQGGRSPSASRGAPVSLIFGVAERGSFSGGCPADMAAFLDAGCEDRTRCVIGSKTLRAFAQGDERHHNPKLTGLAVNGQATEAGAEVAVKAGLVELLPSWSADSLERRPSDGGPARESLLMSWFSTAGDYGKQRSFDEVPGNALTLPGSVTAVTVWVVARDGRGGVDWLERRLRVK